MPVPMFMPVQLGEDVLKFQGIYLDPQNREQTEYHLDRKLTDTLWSKIQNWILYF